MIQHALIRAVYYFPWLATRIMLPPKVSAGKGHAMLSSACAVFERDRVGCLSDILVETAVRECW